MSVSSPGPLVPGGRRSQNFSPYFQTLVKTQDGVTTIEYRHDDKGQWSTAKSETIHSDKVRATNYSLEIKQVTRDLPWKIRHEDDFDRDTGLPKYVLETSSPTSWAFPTLDLYPGDQFMNLVGNADSEAITKVRNKLRDGKVQNGAGIGQARQTANELAKSARQLLSAYKAAKSGDWGSVARHLGVTKRDVLSGRSLSERWLEYIYGWLPLMGDIHDNYQLLTRQVKQKDSVFTVTANVSFNYARVATEHNQDYSKHWTCTSKSRAQYKVRLNNGFLEGLDTAGVLNPLSIAWELVPFTFVVDWFVPIGNVLESLTATAGLTFLDGFWSSTQECKFYAELKGVENRKLLQKGGLEVVNFNFHRNLLNDFALPQLYGKTNPFSTTHTLSALALLRQLL